MRSCVFVVLILTGLSLTGCQSVQTTQYGTVAFNEPYVLDSGDRLRIIVFDQQNLSNTYTIDQSGHLALPLIGAVAARGRTTGELEKDISDRLRNGYLRSPDVTVEIDQLRPFFILGEVRNAGQYPSVPGMSVQSAVAIAGGFTPRAKRSTVRVSRQINGSIITGSLGLADQVRPGDTLYVQERLF